MFLINNQDDHNRIDNSSIEYINKKIDPNQQDIINDDNKKEIEKFKFFRLFLWYFYSDKYNWKSLVHSIYHIEHLINNLDNYQIKESIQKPFKILLNYFISFIKDLITIQIKSQKQNQSSKINDTFVSGISLPEQHIQNLKLHINNLKELILTTKVGFNLCKTDINAVERLLQSIDNINFDSKIFDKQDQDKIRLLSLKQDLSQKSNKTDLIQMKVYIDNQIKKLIELNKQNAKELEQIKLLKMSTCQTRHIQSILSTNSSNPKKPNRMYSYQTSRPYITFELDHIRNYQRQALLKSPYGTIPLYRRQAWAAANLFPNHSLNFLRYMQNSLRMQIHNLLGYDPSDICKMNNKTKKTNKNLNIEIFNKTHDVSIVGNNNKFYRGRIESCQIIPLKEMKETKLKIKTNINENTEINKIHLDEFDQTIIDESLFEYLDWQIQFNEQDLSDELCEELFHHWTSIVCDKQPCYCNSESKLNLIQPQIDSSSLNSIYDDRCMCSQCSCTCEKYENDESICLCSQCSCKCLKDFQNENQDIIEDIPEISQNNSENEINIKQKFQLIPQDQISIVEEIKEKEITICDCFINRIDRWTQQFDLFQRNDINTIFNSIELDDPIAFRQ